MVSPLLTKTANNEVSIVAVSPSANNLSIMKKFIFYGIGRLSVVNKSKKPLKAGKFFTS